MDLKDMMTHVRRHMDGIGRFPPRGDLSIDEWMEATADWRAAVNRMADALRTELGAAITERGAQGWAVTIGGVRSSSTSGLHGALSNWLVAAEKRVDKAEASAGKALAAAAALTIAAGPAAAGGYVIPILEFRPPPPAVQAVAADGVTVCAEPPVCIGIALALLVFLISGKDGDRPSQAAPPVVVPPVVVPPGEPPEIAPVPVPAAWASLAAGLAGLAGLRRRRRAAGGAA